MSDPSTRTRLIFNVDGIDVSLIVFDATGTLTHAGDVEITEHPLEDGSNIADGARAKQPTLQLEGVLVDQPFIAPGLGEEPARAGRATYLYAVLMAVKNAGGVLEVRTPLFNYDNMLIKSISAPQATNTGSALKFTMQLTQVKLVRTQTVKLKAVKTAKAQPNQKDGAKNATPAPPAVTARSLWQKSTSPGGLFSPVILGRGG